jgi:polyvinyl alcohol dehydrogenase (cytochrome)
VTRGQRSALLLIALGVCMGTAIGISAQGLGGQSAASSGPRLPDRAAGEAIYGQRCASCHDHPEGRVPAKQVISGNTPAYIFSALHGGIMSEAAHGLTTGQMSDVATYLSRNLEGGIVSRTGEAPPCPGSPPLLRFAQADWNGWGHDPANSRFQPNPGLAAADVARLKLKWAVAMSGDRAGQPTIVGGRLFINNTAGIVYSLDAATGCLYWRFQAASGTRTTMTVGALAGNGGKRYALYFADRRRDVYALDAESGALLWKTHVDDQPSALMTGSPTLYGGRLYVPISSAEEYYATFDTYPCCRFRGAVAALDAATGRMLWKTYTTPVVPHPTGTNAKGVTRYGPAGGAVWSAPTIDAKLGLLYVGTGNSYSDTPDAGSDSVIAMNLASGAIRWTRKLTPEDNYIIGCYRLIGRGANCPTEVGGDYDVGDSPILVSLADGHRLLLVGQKSSQVWALDPDRGGAVVWTQRLSPGGSLGGVEFGPASDGRSLYVGISDIFLRPGAREDARPGLTAFNVTDSRIVWQKPSPRLPCRWSNEYCNPAISQAVSVIPGVVFAGAMNGRLRAYSTADGSVLWDFDAGGGPFATLSGRPGLGGVLDAAGPVVANGMVYVNSGYAGRSETGGTLLMAFSVDGR